MASLRPPVSALVAFYTLLTQACDAPAPDDTDAPRGDTATDAIVGPTRLVYGRIHDVQDLERGLPGARATLGGVTAIADLTGAYRVEGPATARWVRYEAEQDGWTPFVVHLPDDPQPGEFWPGMLPIDETERGLAIMSATSGVAPTWQPDQAYLLVQVRHVGRGSDLSAGAEVQVEVPTGPAPVLYVMTYNATFGECLPVRAAGSVALTDPACDGIVAVPELLPDVEVNITLTHPERRCARTKELRLAGETVPPTTPVSLTLPLQANALNLTGLECDDD